MKEIAETRVGTVFSQVLIVSGIASSGVELRAAIVCIGS